MNYLPFCGGWFYGAVNTEQRVSFFCSWGLLEDAPDYTPPATDYMPQEELLGVY